MPCLRPEDLRSAYFPGETASAPAGNPQTIALVDAYNDFKAEADLEVYAREFGLPELAKCKSSDETACFEQVNQAGSNNPASLPFPRTAADLEGTQEACEEAELPLLEKDNEEVQLVNEVETKRGERASLSEQELAELEAAEAELEELEEGKPPARFLRKRVSETGELACIQAEEAEGWAMEISLDVQTAHAICRNCKILLVEAGRSTPYAHLKEFEADPPSSDANLDEAEETATASANEVSNSWGGPEPTPRSLGEVKAVEEIVATFAKPEEVITAATGDDGYLEWGALEEAEAEYESCESFAAVLETQQEREEEQARCREITFYESADFPATTPTVIAAGGTKLDVSGGTYRGESVWNEQPVRTGPGAGESYGAGGGGCSTLFAAPPWQLALADWGDVGCGRFRATADIASDADPFTGIAVYDSVPELGVEENDEGEVEFVKPAPLGWLPIGGTSAASPLIASMFALAGGANGVEHPVQTLYEHLNTATLHHVSLGGNGECDNDYSTGCSGSLSRYTSGSLRGLLPFDCGAGALICNAAPGCGVQYYDGPTGVGTPNGVAAFIPGQLEKLPVRECESSGQGGGGQSGSGGSGGQGGTPQPEAQPAPKATPTPEPPGSDKKTHTTPRKHRPARVSRLRLTRRARAALSDRSHRRLAISSLRFSFKLSARAKVRIALSHQVRKHGKLVWRTVGADLKASLPAGIDRAGGGGRARLRPGRYRVTVSLGDGHAASLRFRVR